RLPLLLGRYRVQAKNIWVEPHDRTFVHPIPVRRDPRAKDGEFVKVRLLREPGGVAGEVIARLGTSGDARFEILASAYAEGFSDEFDRATLLAAESVPDHVLREEIAGRRDLRNLPLVPIDGEDARAFYEAVMRSHARLTYSQVASALENPSAGELPDLLPDLQLALELSKRLTQRRRERGSIDFDLPEAKIVLADDGTVSEIVRRPRNDAHRLVEELMLAANEAVARFFDARGLPTVYRIHDVPDEEKLEAFAQLARTHGFELPEVLNPSALNEFLKAVEGKPAQKAL